MAKIGLDYRDRIIRDPEVLVGKPVVKGTRISVVTVLEHLRDNPDFHDLFEAYPRLTMEDVKACLGFAAERVRSAPKARKQSLVSSGHA